MKSGEARNRLARLIHGTALRTAGIQTSSVKWLLSMHWSSLPNVLLVVAATLFAIAPAAAESEPAEPTHEQCAAAVDEARALAVALPAEDLSRYFAESFLQQALTEGGNGEFDECLEYAEQATLEVKERRHQLMPGDTFKVLQADEWVAPDGTITRLPRGASAPSAQEPK
jgi:hypothetical protein